MISIAIFHASSVGLRYSLVFIRLWYFSTVIAEIDSADVITPSLQIYVNKMLETLIFQRSYAQYLC